MIGSLLKVKVDSNLSHECASRHKYARSGNTRGALLSLLILALACLGSVNANAQNWKGSTVSDATGKTVYLWNVGAKKFLGKGGRWGTEAVISNVGTPYTLKTSNGKIYLTSLAKAQGGTSNGCLEFMNGTKSTSVHDAGNFFVDRNYTGATTQLYSYTGSQTAYQFQVTSTEGKSDEYIGTFYLVANTTTGKVQGEKTVSSASEDYSKWIVVTLDERKAYFEQAEASESSAVPATFLMDDQDFARNDLSVTSWKTMSSSSVTTFDGTLTNGTETLLPSDAYPSTTTTTERTYTYTYTGTHTWRVSNGRFDYKTYSHDVTYTLTTTDASPATTLKVKCSETKPGTDSQSNHDATESVTVTLDKSKTTYEDKDVTTTTKGYTYYVGNGYDESDTKTDEDGKTYSDAIHWQELYGGDWTANIHGSYGVVNQTISNDNMIRKGWYKVSCVGFTTATTGKAQLYASAGTANEIGDEYNVQPLTKLDSDRPTTYVKASKLINNNGSKYEASVMVYVGPKSDGSETLKTLSFGIEVEGADASDWTCFDNFQIEYLGDPSQELVLDEEQTSVDYINAQKSSELNKKKVLYLHRTLNVGKWNSIVLPVDLTVGQVQSAFGSDVKISEFKGAKDPNLPNRIYFDPITVDRNNANEVAINAGKLYIIKPTKGEPTDQDKVSFPKETNIEKTLTSYFKIVGVNKSDDAIKASVEGEKGNEVYGGSQIQFVGTYVSDPDGGKSPSIPANSYVLNGNNVGGEAGLWYYRTEKTNTKGFRGWLQPTAGSSAAKQLEYDVNGKVYTVPGTTGIQGIIDDLNAKESNIYNLNGQLVRANATSRDGLTKGVYIQNGKKFIVK